MGQSVEAKNETVYENCGCELGAFEDLKECFQTLYSLDVLQMQFGTMDTVL